MNEDSLLRRIESFRGKKVLIVGDIMLDEYIWGKVNRISPEAPVPVVKVGRESRAAGGAGNVARNVALLGMEAHVAGIIGRDYHGRILKKLFGKIGVMCEGVCDSKGISTVVKTRIVAHSQHMVRIDRENQMIIPDEGKKELRDRVVGLVSLSDFIIVSDYNKGTVCREVYQPLIEEAAKRGKMVIVDPKKRDVKFYRGCTVITPNKKETEEFSGIEVSSEEEILRAGRKILSRTGAKGVLITRGEEGMTLVIKGAKKAISVPAIAKEVYDVTGAGDTVISTFSASLAGGGSYEEAAILSNIAAAAVVEEVGTSPITRKKLESAVRRYRSS